MTPQPHRALALAALAALALAAAGCGAASPSVHGHSGDPPARIVADAELSALDLAAHARAGQFDDALATADAERCVALCEHVEAICDIAERICGLAAERPSEGNMLTCERASARCRGVGARVPAECVACAPAP